MADDDYGRKYLGTDDALYAEKRVSRTTFRIVSAISGLTGLLGLGALAAGISGDPQGLIAGLGILPVAAFLGVLGILESVGRTVVLRDKLRLSSGMRDLDIPLTSIRETSIGVFKPTVKFDVAKDRATVRGPSKVGDTYVRVRWVDAKGKERIEWVVSEDPQPLIAAIRRTAVKVRAPGEEDGSELGEELEVESRAKKSRAERD